MRTVAIWVGGLLAGGIVGSLVGSDLSHRDGGFFGFIAGALAFAGARLWLMERGKSET